MPAVWFPSSRASPRDAYSSRAHNHWTHTTIASAQTPGASQEQWRSRRPVRSRKLAPPGVLDPDEQWEHQAPDPPSDVGVAGEEGLSPRCAAYQVAWARGFTSSEGLADAAAAARGGALAQCVRASGLAR
jgi:hypothetical protein